MENKFYTPKIEEMSVGFECEQMQLRNRNSPSVYEEWNPITIDGFDLSIALENSDDLSELFRVKHLDREDIESLGWMKEGNFYYLKRDFQKYKLFHTGTLEDEIPNDWVIWDLSLPSPTTIFRGTILNKSRLKLVMEMLNINQDAK